MKAIKLLILSLLFVAATQEAGAQNVVVNNNNPTTTFNVVFNFAPPCPAIGTSTAPSSSTASSFAPGCSLLAITIYFVDNTCNPPQPVSISVPFTTNPTIASYTLCNGQPVNFHLIFDGTNYVLDIL